MTWLKFVEGKQESWVNLNLVRVVRVYPEEVQLQIGKSESISYYGKEAKAFLAAFREAAVKP